MKRIQQSSPQQRGKFQKTTAKKGKDRQLIKIRPVFSIVTREILAIQVANGYSITETLKSLPGYTLHYIYYFY